MKLSILLPRSAWPPLHKHLLPTSRASRYGVTLMCMILAGVTGGARAEEPGRTTLSDPSVRYSVPEKPYAILARGDVEAVVVDNRAVNDTIVRDHAAGYSGLAVLRHTQRRENLFVPAYAGLNFEHIHDGTVQAETTLFEPRKPPMELRRISEHIVELYQKPTPHWAVESCTRYEMLADAAIQMTFEWIPRRRSFRNNYIGLFWASYIHQPQSGAIHFLGHPLHGDPNPRFIESISPAHGIRATHLATDDQREFPHDDNFPLSLVFNRSEVRFDEPWYYGLSHGMAFVQIFRSRDQVRFAQSPSGGGSGNPAWDFQTFVSEYEVDRLYSLVMRVLYVPFQSAEQIRRAVEPHRLVLESR